MSQPLTKTLVKTPVCRLPVCLTMGASSLMEIDTSTFDAFREKLRIQKELQVFFLPLFHSHSLLRKLSKMNYDVNLFLLTSKFQNISFRSIEYFGSAIKWAFLRRISLTCSSDTSEGSCPEAIQRCTLTFPSSTAFLNRFFVNLFFIFNLQFESTILRVL